MQLRHDKVVATPYSDSLSLRLRQLADLSSLHKLTRRLILQKARYHTLRTQHYYYGRNRALTACRRRGFRNCFTPLPGCFSPFPHGTIALSVAEGI